MLCAGVGRKAVYDCVKHNVEVHRRECGRLLVGADFRQCQKPLDNARKAVDLIGQVAEKFLYHPDVGVFCVDDAVADELD